MTTAYFSLASGDFNQDWSDPSLITSDDDWSGVPSIVGYRGDDLTSGTGDDPRTVVADGSGTPVEVIADQSNPDTLNAGGIAEFDGLANPTVALQGSGTADAPHLVLHLDATGRQNLTLSFTTADIDGSADDAAQPVVAQYRVGETGDFTTLEDSYIADVTSGGATSAGTTLTVDLPEAVNGAAQVQVRIMTTNAAGSDEWVSVDDISVTSEPEAIPGKVLLTEVVVTPTGGEFIEIHNPTGAAIDLEDLYLSDATFSNGGTYYYNLPTGSNAGGGAFGDFLAQFPVGATIDAGEYQTIALAGSEAFFTEYGIDPTYELFEDGATADGVADMREGAPGSISDQGGLTNSGEMVALFEWDGASDLVTDHDYVVWGDKDEAVDKTGASIDGPDADATASTYQDETAIEDQEVIATGAHADGNSWQRVDLSEGSQTATGGNGVGGTDETSENLSTTWTEAEATPGAAYVAPVVPELSIADASADEDAGTLTFTVTRSGQTSGEVTVDYATADGTATMADGDYVAASGTLTFADGETEKTVTVTLTGDASVEDDETFTVTLSNASGGAVVTDGEATGTIANDDLETTLISAIQGAGDESPLVGETVRVQGVVTSVVPGRDGFYMQEEDADGDGDAATSEGIFVYLGEGASVSEGDLVTVTGSVSEYFDFTQISADADDVTVESSGNLDLVSETELVRSNYGSNDDPLTFEAYEGMIVSFAEELTVSEYYELFRYGQITLYADGRPEQFSQFNEPDATGYEAYMEELAARRIILDDGNSSQNASLPDGVIPYPMPDGLSIGTQGEDFFRGGDVVVDLTGVFNYTFGEWVLDPTEAEPVEFTPVNTRPEDFADAEPNQLRVASFNVLNYFTTIDDGANTTDTGAEPRGADSTLELERQTDKIVAALAEIDADVYGLIEIENDGDNAATQALVDALNLETGKNYDLIETGLVGGDAIRQAIIYDADAVTPTGDFAVLDDAAFTDPLNTGGERNRPAVTQAFTDNRTGETFVVSVNHLKSKGSLTGATEDEDQGDGAGNNNETRKLAAEALAAWLATDPTGAGSERVVILGDMNSYEKEDPIDEILAGADGVLGTEDDYVNLVDALDPDAYSYLFDGQIGTLDYIFGSQKLMNELVSAGIWNTNADEIPQFDYNDDVQDPSEQSYEEEPDGNPLYEPNAFRSSDHDAVVVDFLLNGAPEEDDVFVASAGAQSFTLGAGSDTLRGTLDALLGDTVTDFTTEDRIIVSGSALSREAFSFDAETGQLEIDSDDDGTADGAITLEGDFSGGDFMAVALGGETLVSFETFLPDLGEGAQVDAGEINGVNNQAFLTGDGMTGFRVSLNQGLAGAKFDNALGVYEIDEDGNIVDVRILLDSVKEAGSATADITGVEEGHELGFFLVQDGADWAEALAEGDSFAFVDGLGGPDATVESGSDILLTVNGEDAGQTVFHSYDASLNVDEAQHALSGVNPGGTSITVGFEDLVGTGDSDFQDLVFEVETFALGLA
ncbi:ExeM/NucH family extracellular endonuclease [Allosediminivita pacifica]|uniref:Putative extracellular nuclease n=1 Tax=Allosediminivita pacifica TaxID=1267769 RepID=A0A2T6AQK9_9RHOB|nr:ExeM/NucH family extracellular endonuclease [Allosediminivita pacifica]PTX46114.1 putative extracellular nuclease [Allosediminivita pacifica]GGB18170.1 hypothetical protein GCM10011324_30440 [Allosediminivita pacifica]